MPKDWGCPVEGRLGIGKSNENQSHFLWIREQVIYVQEPSPTQKAILNSQLRGWWSQPLPWRGKEAFKQDQITKLPARVKVERRDRGWCRVLLGFCFCRRDSDVFVISYIASSKAYALTTWLLATLQNVSPVSTVIYLFYFFLLAFASPFLPNKSHTSRALLSEPIIRIFWHHSQISTGL